MPRRGHDDSGAGRSSAVEGRKDEASRQAEPAQMNGADGDPRPPEVLGPDRAAAPAGERRGQDGIFPVTGIVDSANPKRVGRARVCQAREQAEREGDQHDSGPSALHRLDSTRRRGLTPPADLAATFLLVLAAAATDLQIYSWRGA